MFRPLKQESTNCRIRYVPLICFARIVRRSKFH